jgi:hypothetical protein
MLVLGKSNVEASKDEGVRNKINEMRVRFAKTKTSGFDQ